MLQLRDDNNIIVFNTWSISVEILVASSVFLVDQG